MRPRIEIIQPLTEYVCPVEGCGALVLVLRREDHTPLAEVGVFVSDDMVRYFLEPCGHRVIVHVVEFGAGIRFEAYNDQ